MLRQFIRPVAKEQGIYFKGFGWRTFRRLNITALQAPGGVNVFEAMAQAGHTKPEDGGSVLQIPAESRYFSTAP